MDEKTFRMRLRELRLQYERDTPMAVLSQLMGFNSPSAIYRFESGQRRPSFESFYKIISYFKDNYGVDF